MGMIFLLEETLVLGLGSLAVRVGSKLILSLSGDVVLGGNILGSDTHGDLALGSISDLLKGLGGSANRVGAVVVRHGLDTGTNTNVNLTTADLEGNVVDGHQTRGALSVKGNKRNRVGDAGIKGSSSVLGSTRTRVEDITDNNIADKAGVDLGALKQALEKLGDKFSRGGILEAPLPPLVCAVL